MFDQALKRRCIRYGRTFARGLEQPGLNRDPPSPRKSREVGFNRNGVEMDGLFKGAARQGNPALLPRHTKHQEVDAQNIARQRTCVSICREEFDARRIQALDHTLLQFRRGEVRLCVP